jgi:hypothetical protein
MHIAGPVVVHRLLKEYQCLEAEYGAPWFSRAFF